jgi:ADP-ribosyl-[dinitrogen reductase] hydrolase
MKRTSKTHPLQIAAISSGLGKGSVGVTFCPGKKDNNAMTGSWDRDLGTDLDAIRDWGAAAVVTLIEQHEIVDLKASQLGVEVAERKMAWFHLPIADVSTPDYRFEEAWSAIGGELRSMLDQGRHVLVHCKGGLGRAGTIGARLLVEMGMTPKMAIARIREVRPGAIETSAQERYVLGLRPRLK